MRWMNMGDKVLLGIKKAYDEACNCGYNGSLVDYVKAVGVDISKLRE
jgi:hypothetical protein